MNTPRMNTELVNTAPINCVLVMDYSLAYVGGAQRAMIDQANALAKLGCQVSVVTFAPTNPFREQVRLLRPRPAFVVPIIKFPLYRNTQRLRTQFGRLFDRLHPDLVIVHSEFALAHAAVDAASARSIPTAQTVHTIGWNGPTIPLPRKIISALIDRIFGHHVPLRQLGGNRTGSVLRSMTFAMGSRVGTVISPSQHQAEALKRGGVSNVVAIPNVTAYADVVSQDTNATEPHSASAPAPTALRLLWVGRPAPEKNLPLAIDAVKLAAQRGADVVLRVAGPKRLRGNEVIQPLGEVDHTVLQSEYAAADAVLLTSNGFDNLPMVAIEGFANGVPVITVDPALGAEFGDAAILSVEATPTALAGIIVQFAEDEELRQHARAGARHYAAGITPESHLRKLEGLLTTRKPNKDDDTPSMTSPPASR